jgi:mannose-6-phosphate isomerase-like protein (cupin superfamily)
VSLPGALVELERLLDETERVLAPARFVAEAARPAAGPCDRPDGSAGQRRLLATRFATCDPADTDDAAVSMRAARVAQLWSERGCRVRTTASESLGHEVVAATPSGGILVFGIAGNGMTLGGETACVRAGCTMRDNADPRREEQRVAEDASERQGSLTRLANDSDAFRRVVVTGPHMQLAVMTIPPGGEVGEEVHQGTDQFLFFVEGQAEAQLDGARSAVPEGSYVFVPAGTRHNFVNTGSGPLRIATTYAPPEHPAGTVHATKEVADAEEAHH